MFRKASGVMLVGHVGIVSRLDVVQIVLSVIEGREVVVVLRRHGAIDGDEDEDRKASSTKVGGRAEQSRTLDGALYR